MGIVACSYIIFFGHDDSPIILPPSQNVILEKIVARIHPQNISLSQSSLIPASFLSNQNLAPSRSYEVSSLLPERKHITSSAIQVSEFWEKNLSADPLETTLVIQSLKIASLSTVIPKSSVVTVKIDSDGTVLSFGWRLSSSSRVDISRGVGNQFTADVSSDIPQITERIVSGTIQSSLIEAARRSDVAYASVDEFVDMMGEKVDFRRDLQKGDAFAMILRQEQYSDGSWGKPIELLGAGLINNGKLKAVTKVLNKSGKFQSFDELGQPIGNHFLQYPVKFTRVSSIFTDSRLHPVLKIKRPHNGVDFAAPTGTPVRSVGDGVIEKAGYFGAAGNMIKISHSKRWSTAYLHLSKIDKSIRVGARVSKGQLIGAVGSTGLSSGPHLHFSLYDNNKYVDPIKTKLPGIYNEKDLPSNNIIQASLAPLKKQLENVMIANASNKLTQG